MDTRLQADLKDVQDRTRKIYREWDNFVRTGNVQKEDVIPAEVLSSWIRCRNKGVDPYKYPDVCLNPEELNERLEANHTLLKVISPFLQAITDSIQETGFKIDIFDKDLYLLKQFGLQSVLDTYLALNAGPGASRSESDSGTNAINLAAILERPVQLVGPEHYNVAFHGYTCTSVPIKDHNGRVIAVINTVGDYWLLHKHTLGMMIALGKSIEYSLLQRKIRKEVETANRFNQEIIESITDALIFVDTGGEVTAANKTAQTLLSRQGNNIIGQKIETLWGSRNPFTEVLKTGETILGREIILDQHDKKIRLIGTVRPIGPEETELEGVMGTFKGLNDARGMIKNFAGWKAHFTFESLIGDCMEFRHAVRLAKETSKMQSNILIQGESGTGKELFAQAIHNASLNNEGPFVVVNCAAIPSGLLESELFGYEGGAFTGAKRDGQSGKFELAEGGTIFLDEINSLPIDMQAKFLRTLQNKTITRVGGREEIPVNLRIIAASNTDLWQMVRRGEFREDLFYRINVITISIPPLRERGDDINLFIGHILKQLTKRNGFHLTIEHSAIELLKNYNWPGNIRELENVLERSYIMARSMGSRVITAGDVQNYPGIREFLNKKNIAFNNELNQEENQSGNDLKEMEKITILKTLKVYDGNITLTANALGVARNTIYRKLKLYGIKYVD